MVLNFKVKWWLLIFLLSLGCGEETLIRESKLLLGTQVEVKVYHRDRERAEEVIDLAFQEVERIENLLSKYRKGSDVSLLNRESSGNEVKVNPETLKVINASLRYAELTNGTFDITVAPLMELWGFVKKESRIPTDEEIVEALSLINHKGLILNEVEGTVMFGKEGMSIDLGGVAKGYAVDRAIVVLRREGIKSGMVNAGGDIFVMGSPSDRDFWRIAVEHPKGKGKYLTILELKDQAVATSGDYRKFFEIGGKRYCHIMDPRTGRPVKGMLSVTTIADSCLEADALATAVFVMGKEKGLKLINGLPSLEAIVVAGDGERMEAFTSKGLSGVKLDL